MKATFSIVEWSLVFCLVAGTLDLPDYLIRSNNLPEDVRFRPVIGNGHIATNILSDTVYMNGLFNGREDMSSRARIQADVAIDVTKDDDVSRTYALNMQEGTFCQYIQKSNVNVTITYFAHRKFTRLFVTQIDMRRVGGDNETVLIPLTVNKGNNSNDFGNVREEKYTMQNPSAKTLRYYTANVRDMEIPGTEKTQLHVYHTLVPSNITLPAGQDEMSVTFVASLSQDNMDARNSVNEAYRGGLGQLLPSHKQAWLDVWNEGRITVEGNSELGQNIAAALYSILCSVPDKDDQLIPFFGLSPGGLSRGGLLVPDRPGGGDNDYAGHVFWDMDTWMMPGIMMLHPSMARRMIGSRTRVLDQVKKNAREAGFKGAKYPWEQATTGIEATPNWAGNTSFYQIHITADIAYGLRQYLYATNDGSILLTAERGFELALETARFWQSRVTFYENGTGAEILGVMGPDEYHFNISNSVYTNYNAKLNLMLPQYIVNTYNMQMNASVQEEIRQFNRTAELLVILFDEDLQYHPQYEGFDRSRYRMFRIPVKIKQSDVILLGYPLMMEMPKSIRQNDLEIYENITDPVGPDTGTWSMHTVGWLELGDEERAYKSFKMMSRNINEPFKVTTDYKNFIVMLRNINEFFKVFSENPVSNTSSGGCVNFITAAGGLLQAVLFGYGGLRLHEDRLTLNPRTLPGSSSWSMVNLNYRGVTFDLTRGQGSSTIRMTNIPDDIVAYINVNKQTKSQLVVGKDHTFNNLEIHLSVEVKMTTPEQSGSGASDVTSATFASLFFLALMIRYLH